MIKFKEYNGHTYESGVLLQACVDGYEQGIKECSELFAKIMSNMTNICGRSCPIRCEWGTEDSYKDIYKKWFVEKLKEQNKV